MVDDYIIFRVNSSIKIEISKHEVILEKVSIFVVKLASTGKIREENLEDKSIYVFLDKGITNGGNMGFRLRLFVDFQGNFNVDYSTFIRSVYRYSILKQREIIVHVYLIRENDLVDFNVTC